MKRAGLKETRVEGEAIMIKATAIIDTDIIARVKESDV